MLTYWGIIAILLGIYLYMRSNNQEPMKNQQSFIASETFAGEKNGYVYKMDSQGLGYYLDHNSTSFTS